MWVLLCSRLWLDVMVCGSGTGACRICVAVCDGVSFSSLVHLSPCSCKRTVLKKGVTDEGLRALASAGRGRNMASRCFSSEGAFVWMEVFPPLRVMMIASLFLCPLATRIDLGGGVADSGLPVAASI